MTVKTFLSDMLLLSVFMLIGFFHVRKPHRLHPEHRQSPDPQSGPRLYAGRGGRHQRQYRHHRGPARLQHHPQRHRVRRRHQHRGHGHPTPSTGFTEVTSDLYYKGGYLATLKIPSLNVNVKVYEGTGSSVLAKGAGHIEDASIWDGNCAIAGHNRGANCYFGDIHNLNVGDTITLTTRLGTRTYSVTSVNKISETDNSLLAPTAENCVTLFTCVRNQSAYRWAVRAVEVLISVFCWTFAINTIQKSWPKVEKKMQSAMEKGVGENEAFYTVSVKSI